jgi:hypothetical protein
MEAKDIPAVIEKFSEKKEEWKNLPLSQRTKLLSEMRDWCDRHIEDWGESSTKWRHIDSQKDKTYLGGILLLGPIPFG